METRKIYKIRDKRTGLYSMGGTGPGWSKKGKEWKTLAHVMAHLSQFYQTYYRQKVSILTIPDDWEIIEFTVTVEETLVRSARSTYKESNGFKNKVLDDCGHCRDYDDDLRDINDKER
jgi:hypothetical protein